VPTSQVHVDRGGAPRSTSQAVTAGATVTAAGFVSCTYDVRSASRAERAAAGGSICLGLLLLVILPTLLDAALYVAVLGGAAASAALVAGVARWSRPGLAAWAVAAIAAEAVLLLQLVESSAGLPDIDRLEVCRRVRAGGGGVLILTARGGELDRVVGLDMGADDYMSKPFGWPSSWPGPGRCCGAVVTLTPRRPTPSPAGGRGSGSTASPGGSGSRTGRSR
jgi:CheY-like chemotaxis protein